MCNFTVEQQADNILASKRRTNRQHPHDPTKRIIGWIVDNDQIGLGVGLLALEEIEKRAAPTVSSSMPAVKED